MYSNIANKQIGRRSLCCQRRGERGSIDDRNSQNHADLKRVASPGNVVHAQVIIVGSYANIKHQTVLRHYFKTNLILRKFDL